MNVSLILFATLAQSLEIIITVKDAFYEVQGELDSQSRNCWGGPVGNEGGSINAREDEKRNVSLAQFPALFLYCSLPIFSSVTQR